jgi:hypothetical protein
MAAIPNHESLSKDHIENTASNISSIIACVAFVAEFVELLPSNGRLLWLYYSTFQVLCQNIY